MRGFSAEVQDSDTVQVSLLGGGQTTFEPVDTAAVTDSVSVYVAGELEIQIDDSVTGVDYLTTTEFEADYCTPIGYSDLPYIELQRRIYSGGSGQAGSWGEWESIHGHQFTDTNGVDYRRDRWGVLELPIGDVLYELTEGYNTRTFPYVCRLWFEIDWHNPFCKTEFLSFMYDYALDWLAGASSVEQRRIRFYPAGLGQHDRTGALVDPLQVIIDMSEDFWSRHSEWGGRRGAYEGKLVLSSCELFTPGTYPFTSDNWQYYIPWSEAMPIET